MPFVVALTPLVDVVGWSHQDPLGLAIRVALVFALVGVVTLAVGWVEDVAARRPPELVPGARRPVPAGVPPTSPPPAGAARPVTVGAAVGGANPPPGGAGSRPYAGSARVPAPRASSDAKADVSAG